MFTVAELLVALAVLASSVAALLFGYYRWAFDYWRRRGVTVVGEPTFPYGSATGGKEQIGLTFAKIYAELKARGEKHGGLYMFTDPWYLPVDLETLRNVLSKDFQYFTDRGLYVNEKDDPLTGHLFLIGGKKWRSLRTKLTPTFTSGKMKMMFDTLLECEKFLTNQMEHLSAKGEPIDIKDILGRFTTDIIASCAFGLELRTMEDENSLFRVYMKRFFGRDSSVVKVLKRYLMTIAPELARTLHVKSIDNDISEFFLNVVKDTVGYRERNKVSRKDFMQLLIEMRKELSIEEIAAQSFVFFLAGYETSSTTMTFALYELAKHQEIQQKVREEIHQVLKKYDGKITYEGIQEMKYMNQVIDETLRKYPPLSFITRLCVQDYKVPNSDLTIETGTRVAIPILALQNDPEFWNEPDKFDPERFSEANKPNHHSYSYMPFGEGPRLCIGMRFGMMQSKVGLASLLNTYNFTINPKTEQPLKFKARSFVLAAEGEVWLDAKKID